MLQGFPKTLYLVMTNRWRGWGRPKIRNNRVIAGTPVTEGSQLQQRTSGDLPRGMGHARATADTTPPEGKRSNTRQCPHPSRRRSVAVPERLDEPPLPGLRYERLFGMPDGCL